MKLIFMILAIMPTLVMAESRLETIELKHRLASEIVPQIQALMPSDATIRSFDNQVIFKADEQTRATIRQLIQNLDTQQHNLSITVMRTTEQLTERSMFNDSFNIDLQAPSRSTVEINRWSTRDNRDREQQYQVSGLAGEPLSIQLGQLIPQQEKLVLFGPRGAVAVLDQTRYIPLENGFQALINLFADDKLRIEIHPLFSEFNQRDGRIDSSSLLTTVNGELNHWLMLGQTGEKDWQEGHHSYRSRRDEQQFIYLKVELN